MINHYFKPNLQEILTLEDNICEAIERFGFSAYYLPRDSFSATDTFYSDDPLKSFTKAYSILIYLETPMDVRDNNMFSKFGLQINNEARIIIGRRQFKRDVPELVRPMEGDLIFISGFSKNGEIYEIKSVDDTTDLYTLQRSSPYIYGLGLELFKFDQNKIDVGIQQIDDLNNDAFSIDFALYSGNGIDYMLNEYVWDGHSNSAIVLDWDKPTNTISTINLVGNFTANANVIGNTSGAIYKVREFNELLIDSPHIDSDNYTIKTETISIINTDITNPLGGL